MIKKLLENVFGTIKESLAKVNIRKFIKTNNNKKLKSSKLTESISNKQIKRGKFFEGINNKELKSKLIFLISLFSISIIILGFISIMNISKINDSAEKMYKNNMLANVYLAQLNEKNLQLEKYELQYVLSNYGMDQSQISTEIANIQASIPKTYLELTNLELSPYITEKLNEYDTAVNKTISEYEKLQQLVKNKEKEAAFKYYEQNLKLERVELLNIVNEMRDYNIEQTELTNEQNVKSSKKSIMWMAIITAIIIAYAIVIFIHIYRHFKYPINRLSTEMEKVKNGDLNVSLEYLYDNELGKLSKDFIAMTTEINSMVKQIKKNAEKVAENSKDLLDGTTQMEQFSQHMATEVSAVSLQAETQVQHMNESVRAMEEVSKGISRINESTVEVAELSQHASQFAHQGKDTMNTMQLQMQSILNGSNETYKAIEEFAQTSKEISKFISTIEEISSQVHLLALNASIEAARAGEAGLGFAVVASEVRELANSTKQASNSISKIVKSIQVQAQSAVKVVVQEQDEVSRGINDIMESETIFNKITDAVQTISAQLQEVSAATEQMSASAQEVTSSLQEVSYLSDASSKKSLQVAGLAKEQQYVMSDIKNNAGDLDKVANNLNVQAEKFKSM